jgi:hypothetical protein
MATLGVLPSSLERNSRPPSIPTPISFEIVLGDCAQWKRRLLALLGCWRLSFDFHCGRPIVAGKAGTPHAKAACRTPGIAETSQAAYAANRISSNLKGRTKQFGWLQAPANQNLFSFSNFRRPCDHPNL